MPAGVEPHLASVARETLADRVSRGRADDGVGETVTVELSGGAATISVRAIPGGSAAA